MYSYRPLALTLHMPTTVEPQLKIKDFTISYFYSLQVLKNTSGYCCCNFAKYISKKGAAAIFESNKSTSKHDYDNNSIVFYLMGSWVFQNIIVLIISLT